MTEDGGWSAWSRNTEDVEEAMSRQEGELMLKVIVPVDKMESKR